MEAIRSSETSVQTRATWYYIPEYDILRKYSKSEVKISLFQAVEAHRVARD
jgi:hypothetical protein